MQAVVFFGCFFLLFSVLVTDLIKSCLLKPTSQQVISSGCKSGGQSLTLSPNANSNAKVKVITKSHCTDDVGALSMHKPTRAFERGSDVHLTESDKVTPEGKRGSKSQLRE